MADEKQQDQRDSEWRAFSRRLAFAMARVSGVTLALLLTVGCGSRTQINPGADLAIYSGSPQWMFQHIPAGTYKGDARLDGYYSPADGSITISEQLHNWALARVLIHELGHAYDHQRPVDLWELMARYQAPAFDFNFHPEQRDVQRAIEAARQAQENHQ
jgi:hypothetical protein